MGKGCFRDASQQQEDPRMGDTVQFAPDLSDLKRYDCIHWPGHLALMVDETRAVHAKGAECRHIVIESIREINLWRIEEEDGSGVCAVKRLGTS